jgi:YHS domain-containing protein
MKTTVSFLSLALIAALFIAAPGIGQTTKEAEKKPVNKTCPIEAGHAIDPKVTTEYEGKTIGFCCSDCIPTFKKDPKKYMKDLK